MSIVSVSPPNCDIRMFIEGGCGERWSSIGGKKDEQCVVEG